MSTKRWVMILVFFAIGAGFFTFQRQHNQKQQIDVQNLPSTKELPQSGLPQNTASEQNKDTVKSPNSTATTEPVVKSPDLKSHVFKSAIKTYFSKIPDEMRSRVSVEVHDYRDNNVWVHLVLDGVPVEMTEAHLVQNNPNENFEIKSGGLVKFPKVKTIYKNIPNDQIVKIVQESEILKSESFEVVGIPKKTWSYKPGLAPTPVLDVKIKTATSTHSGEVIRINTVTGKILKKYQSVRH